MPHVFDSPHALKDAVGKTVGPTEWLTVDQKRINLFADATGDHQWIHVDTERAKSSPFGTTIAHGFLTLSLVGTFLPQLIEVRRMKMGINYGSDKLRFPSAVRSGSKVRAKGEILKAEDMPDGGIQVVMRITIEIEGESKPACVVEKISRYYAE